MLLNACSTIGSTKRLRVWDGFSDLSPNISNIGQFEPLFETMSTVYPRGNNVTTHMRTRVMEIRCSSSNAVTKSDGSSPVSDQFPQSVSGCKPSRNSEIESTVS